MLLPSNVSSQPGSRDDLDGSVPDSSPAALLLVDVINNFDYPGGDQLLTNARRIAPPIRELKRRVRGAGIPVIYVNDNFGRWRSSLDEIVQRCLAPAGKGRPFVDLLKPDPDDYFVLKPSNSAFYQTPLDVLLKHLGTRRLILAGLTTNSCILFTANDAYMRDLELYVPCDCVAAITQEQQDYSLRHIQQINKANICPASQIDTAKLVA